MKRFILAALAVSFLVASAHLPADEPPDVQMEFARRLRSRRMSALALEWLQRLAKEKNLPAELARRLPLEIARTQVAMAREAPAADRLPLLTEARKKLEEFHAKATDEVEKTLVRLEMARITHYQGQAFLNQAFRAEDKDSREDFANKAEKRFELAKKEFSEAIKAAEAVYKKYAKPATEQQAQIKQRLFKDLQKAKYDQARILIDLAQTYMNLETSEKRLKRGELLEEARKQLLAVAAEGKGGTDQEIPSLAYAWLIHVNMELDEPDRAVDRYNALVGVGLSLYGVKEPVKYLRTYPYKAFVTAKSALPKEAEAGLRWAVYFYIQVLHKHANPPIPKGVTKDRYIQYMCEQWLKTFPAHKTTAAGQGIRFELAKAHLNQALQISKDVKNPKAKKHYELALEYFSKVANSDSDLAERANQYIFPIKIKMIGAKTPVEALVRFDDLMVKARYEMIELIKLNEALSRAKPSEKEKLQKQQKDKIKLIITAFRRALRFADAKTPPNRVDDARFYLAYMYTITGDFYRAAVMSEYLARREPPVRRSPLAARYGIQALQQLLEVEDVPANRRRLRDLAAFVVYHRGKEWSNDPVMAIARHQLALVGMRSIKDLETEYSSLLTAVARDRTKVNAVVEKAKKLRQQFDEIVQLLADLPQDYKAFTFAQAQLGLTGLSFARKASGFAKSAGESGLKSIADEWSQAVGRYQQAAVLALNRIPTLPPKSDPATAQMFFIAQIEHAKWMFENAREFQDAKKAKVALAKYREMAKLADSLQKQFEEVQKDLDDKAREGIGNALKSLVLYSRLGLGEMEYQAGNYDKVLEPKMTGEIVSDVLTLAKGKDRVPVPNFRAVSELVALAMRAHVQKGNVTKAQELLELMQRLDAPPGELGNRDPALPLKRLIGELSRQVNELAKAKDKAKLQAYSTRFLQFFDALLKSRGTKGLDYNTVFFLARSYQILDQHEKAAELYGKIPRPPDFDPKAPLTEQEKTELKQIEAELKQFYETQKAERKAQVEQFQKSLEQAKALLAAYRKLNKSDEAARAEATVKDLEKRLAESQTELIKLQSLDETALAQKAKEQLDKRRQQRYQKELSLWWFIQVYRAEALRKARKLDEAEKLLETIWSDPKAVGKIRAWKEKNHLLEDRGLFGRAITAWSKLLTSRSLRQRVQADPTFKQFYFDCYYQFVWCWYMYSQTGGKAKEDRYLKRAADYILKLEFANNKEGWTLVKDKIEQLLRDAPRLNRVYLEMKKERQNAAG